MADVEWKTLSYLSEYEISEYGDVRRVVACATGKYKAGHMIQGTVYSNGYHAYQLNDDTGKKRYFQTNRIVLEAFVSPPPSSKHQAAHWDGCKLKNHYTNLRWATSKENHADRRRHGTQSRGETHHTAVLIEDEVRLIRRCVKRKEKTQRALAEEYGVTPTCIYCVVKRISWRHV